MRPLTAAVAVSFLLVACGTPQREPSVLDQAAAKAAAAGSARSESVSVMSWEGEAVTTRSAGVHDYLLDRFSMTYESEVGGEKYSSRVIVIGRVTYVEWSLGTETMLPAGKRWLRISADDYDDEAHACDSPSDQSFESEDSPFGPDWLEPAPDELDDEPTELGESSPSVSMTFHSVGVSAYLEPSETLEYLSEFGSQITTLGRESVKNEPMTHYRTELDPREMLRQELVKSGWKKENIDCALADTSPGTERVDVWIDGDGLVRRTMSTTTWQGEHPMTSVETTDLFDHGAEVAIAPPPAKLVVDEGDLAALADDVGKP